MIKLERIERINQIKNKVLPYMFALVLLMVQGCTESDNRIVSDQDPEPKPNATVTATETGAAIYVDGIYTGEVTPAEITVPLGDHIIGVGLNISKSYLRKSVTVLSETEMQNIDLRETDLQLPKTWKALFVGINEVTNGTCVTTYSTAQLDQAFDYFKWSFEQNVEPWSYNVMDWEFTRRDITTDTVVLSTDNLVTPDVFETYISGLNVGDYDLVVSFFRGEQSDCLIGSFIGIAWYDVTQLYANSSYYTIRYYDDIDGMITWTMENDPGAFIHEWLHTVGEIFYPNRGVDMPSSKNGVVHAAEDYNYTFPWMDWYKDIISGQVPEGSTYVGIGPEAFLKCSVGESALGLCN